MPPSATLLSTLLLACIVGLIAAHAASLWARQRFLLLDPLFAFWGGVLIIYVGQPLFFGRQLISWHGEAVFEETLFWSLFGFLFVILGHEMRLGVRIGGRIPRISGTLSPKALARGAYALILLGIVGYMVLFESAGGFAAWIAVGRGATNFESLNGYVTQLAELLPVGIVLLLFQIHIHPASAAKRTLVWLAVGFLLWWFVYLGSRSRLIGLALQILAAYYLPKQKNPPLVLAALGYVVLFVLISFQANFRSNFTNLSLNLDQVDIREVSGKVLPTFLGGDPTAQAESFSRGAEFDCAMAVIDLVPDKVPFNYGYGHLELFTRWIPRSMWADKIYPHRESIQGVLRKGRLSSSSLPGTEMLAGPAFAFVGHWYYVGGPIGLLLGGLLTGVLLRVIRTLYDRGKGQPADLILYASLIGLGFSEAASTPLIWIYTLPFALGPLVILLMLCRERRNAW